MHEQARRTIPATAWYLSILGVDPAAQGRGTGARFYERAGFTLVAWHDEPTTARPYAVLRRPA